MTQLKGSDIKHIAELANLNLSLKEVNLFKNQLSKIIDYVNELSQVDTDDTVPTSQTTGLEKVTRKDESVMSLSSEKALSQAKSTYNNYFKVPVILENKEI